MGQLLSRINSDIEKISFKPFLTTPKTIDKIVRVGSSIFATSKTHKNVVYTTCRISSNVAYMPSDYPWLDTVCRALVRLGVVDRDMVVAYRDQCLENSRRQDARRFRKRTVKQLEEMGIRLTAAQKKKLDKSCE